MIYLYFKGSFNNTQKKERKKEKERNSTKILHRCHNKIWKESLTQRTAAVNKSTNTNKINNHHSRTQDKNHDIVSQLEQAQK